MPKIVVVKKEDVFPGRKVRAGIEPASCVEGHGSIPSMPPPGDVTRSLWCVPEWLLQLRGSLMACPCQCRIIGLAPICRLRTGSAASKRDTELIV